MQQAMSRYAGGLREAAGLDHCAAELHTLAGRGAGQRVPCRHEPGLESWEASNLMTVATAVVASARLREESRGAHWRSDFPGVRDDWHGHLLAERDARRAAAQLRAGRIGDTMLIKTLADAEAAVIADGLDLDAVALIVSEALGEDLGGRGVLPPGTGPGIDVTSYATIAPGGRGPW